MDWIYHNLGAIAISCAVLCGLSLIGTVVSAYKWEVARKRRR